jgi:murein DD-endopeptidase MepM/ murein hydrolase activator NlpD
MTLLRMDLDSLPKVSLIPLKVDTVQRVVDGTIATSFWEDLVSKGHSPALVGRVADILAWQVDFFALQSGDAYRVYYDEFQVGGKGVAQGTIHAVRFQQGATVSEAFHFKQGEIEGYYDAQGHPAKRAFLRAPLQFSRISSFFTGARMHPVLRIVRPHFGVDYAAPAGTPVVAVGDGTVITRGWGGGGGNTIKIRHDNGCMTGYMHLKGFAKGVSLGGRIQQGELIGWVGSTGLSTGPHLDYRFWKNGTPVDPLKVVTPPPPPLPSTLMPQFQQTVASIRQKMDTRQAAR